MAGIVAGIAAGVVAAVVVVAVIVFIIILIQRRYTALRKFSTTYFELVHTPHHLYIAGKKPLETNIRLYKCKHPQVDEMIF